MHLYCFISSLKTARDLYLGMHRGRFLRNSLEDTHVIGRREHTFCIFHMNGMIVLGISVFSFKSKWKPKIFLAVLFNGTWHL